jgi:hypothetical protein
MTRRLRLPEPGLWVIPIGAIASWALVLLPIWGLLEIVEALRG